MPKPQYNVKQTDTGTGRYNQQPPKVYNWASMPQTRYTPMPNLQVPIQRVNPLKNWWNSIVNNARQNAYAPVNTWDTVAPNVPTFNTSTQRTPWDIPYWTPPSVKTPLPQPTYSIFDPFGVPAYGVPQMPTAYGSNTRRGGTPPNRAAMPPAGKYGRGQFPQILNPDSWLVASQNPGSSYERETLAELLARGAVDPNSHDPYEIGGSPYQTGLWVRDPELPVDNGGWGGWGGWGGYGGSSYYSMPNSPRYKGYGGGYGSGGSPRSARYQGGYGSYGGGYGGYAGGQSQRSAWYGALLQWNI